MNKLKLMYDVIKTLKEKEIFKGTLKVEGMKGQAKIFSFDNTFERNNLTGHTRAKTNTEVDCEGKKMKLENSIDVEMDGCNGPHSFMKHIHSIHNIHHNHKENCGGLKEGLNRIAFVLGLINSLKAEEQEDKSVVLSLDLADIPEDLKKAVHEHMNHAGAHHHEEMHGDHKHHLFMKEFHSMEKTGFKFKAFINTNSEVEKINLELSGEQTGENDEKHAMELMAVVCLNW